MAERPSVEVIAQVVARAGSADYQRWLTQVHAAGCCVRPVRLAGKVLSVDRDTGEATVAYSTGTEPDRVLYKACETRRATRCPACAAVYKGDARALVMAGLAGGKGVPDSVAEHPTVFVTLTAPSFGAVHRATDAICRGSQRERCEHGMPRWCRRQHRPEDPEVGSPLCHDCYDYNAAVLFNARAGLLWNRTAIALRRSLAAELDITVRRFAVEYVVSFVKVVEYQRRGVVHLHGLARLDRSDGSMPRVEASTLAGAMAEAASRVRIRDPRTTERLVSWGRELVVAPVSVEDRRRTANYLAKYATKSTDEGGALDHRLRHGDTEHLVVPEHLRRMVETAWTLGERPELNALNLHYWAHALGYRGHWLTKSRSWSTTFGALRDARHAWRVAEARGIRGEGPSSDDDLLEIPDWTYVGMGYRNEGDALLAQSAGRQRRAARRAAWEERS